MEIKFTDISNQQCADIIAHFVKRKNTDEIIIHTEKEDIVITRKKKKASIDDLFVSDGGACACIVV